MADLDPVERFEDFLKTALDTKGNIKYYDKLKTLPIAGTNSLDIDLDDLLKFDPTLARKLTQDPPRIIQAACRAIEITMRKIDKDYTDKIVTQAMKAVDPRFADDIQTFHARFHNLPDTLPLREIRAHMIGNFIQVDGMLTRATEIKSKIISAVYQCQKCEEKTIIPQITGKLTPPDVCTNPACKRKGPFKLLEAESQYSDWQKIDIQEKPEELPAGQIPRRLASYLTADLVDKARPGDPVTITGTLMAYPETQQRARTTIFNNYVDTNNIITTEKEAWKVELTEEDEKKILEAGRDPWIHQKILTSIAPSLYGLETIKEAVALLLFGGIPKTLPDGSKIRGEPNILLVGDPGTGKSQVLIYASNLAPRGLYTAGKGTTAAGLCVHPNTLISTNKGIIPIEKLVEENCMMGIEQVQPCVARSTDGYPNIISSINKSLRTEFTQISKKDYWRLHSPQKLKEVVVRSGKKIILTPKTPLMVLTNEGTLSWIKANDLKEGMYVALSRALPSPKEISRPRILHLLSTENVRVRNASRLFSHVKDILAKKYGSIRAIARKFNIPENKLYYDWTTRNLGIPLNILLTLLDDASISSFELENNGLFGYMGSNQSILLPNLLDPRFLRFLGLIAADGSTTGGRTIHFYNKNKELLDEFSLFVQSIFGLETKVGINKGVPFRTMHSKLITSLLPQLGIPHGSKSHKIDIPPIISQLPDTHLRFYISALFDCDGSVTPRETGGSLVEYSTTSYNLAKKLQLLLLRFEILSRLRKRKPSKPSVIRSRAIVGKKPRYCLEIYDRQSIIEFAQEINFTVSEKCDDLLKIIEQDRKPHTNVDLIPHIGNLIRRLRKDSQITGKELYGRTTSINRESRKNHSFSRFYLQYLISKFNQHGVYNHPLLQQLKVLAFSDIIWEPIKTINEITSDTKYVYDFTVNESHSFIANGFVVHNTAAALRDPETGGFALEAGALVLADQGVAMIDEFDKMRKEDRTAIHQALEQRSISIAKAGIVATLNARCAVLAAANPTFGRYNPFKTPAQNLNLPVTILSRFDLIFVIQDVPEPKVDREMASFIMKLHRDKESEITPPFDMEFLRKYIAFSKQKVQPIMTKEAGDKLEEFYLGMRGMAGAAGEGGAIPITARQLESLVRLSEARARMGLRSEVSVEDAEAAIRLMKTSLEKVAFDTETGRFDIDRITVGKPRSQIERMERIRDIVVELREKTDKSVPINQVVEIAQEEGIEPEVTKRLIEQMKNEGILYEPRAGHIDKA